MSDWILNAATEIAAMWPSGGGRDDYWTDEQRMNIANNLRKIIAHHEPMPPCCGTCKHWAPLTSQVVVGGCGSETAKSLVTNDEWGQFCTRADFGCVEWEAK